MCSYQKHTIGSVYDHELRITNHKSPASNHVVSSASREESVKNQARPKDHGRTEIYSLGAAC